MASTWIDVAAMWHRSGIDVASMWHQLGVRIRVRVRVIVKVMIGVRNNFKFSNVCKKLEKLKGSRGPRRAQVGPK